MQLAEDVAAGLISFDVLLVDDQTRPTKKNVFKILEDVEWLSHSGIKISCVKDNDVEPQTIEHWSNDPARLMRGWSNNQKVLQAAGDAVDGMLTAHAEERVSWVGKAPFGFDIELGEWASNTKKRKDKPFRKLIANKDTEIVKEIFEKFNNGRSIAGLAVELSKADRYTEKKPNPTSVKHILRNAIYTGTWAFGVRNVGKHRFLNESKRPE